LPLLAWDVPPNTQIPYVDAIIAAVVSGDVARIAEYVTGSIEPCTGYPYGYPSCPPDVAIGTPTLAIAGAGCPGDGNSVRLVLPPDSPPSGFTDATTPSQIASSIAQRGGRYLVGVYRTSDEVRARNGIDFRVVFQSRLEDTMGFYLGVTRQGIAEIVGSYQLFPGCGTPSPSEQVIVPVRARS
jgi:hypothetical protein